MAQDWDDLRFFLALSRSTSLVDAAQSLSVSHQTVSRRIVALERRLELRLVDRDGVALRMTPRGQELAQRIAEMEGVSHGITQMARHARERIEGPVRITTGDVANRFFLMPILSRMVETYPDVTIDLIGNNDLMDVSSGVVDFAIRFTTQPDDALIGHAIASIGLRPMGRPDLIAAYDAALTGQAPAKRLPVVDLIDPRGPPGDWIKSGVAPNSPVHRASHIDTMVEFVAQGQAIGMLPMFMADKLPGVVVSAAHPTVRPLELWLLSNSEVRRSEKLKTLRRFLIRELTAIAPQLENGVQA